ncbi:M3 family oligoendopeptidase [Siculibacillus lacustris]|uniref:M3 family oligoendopeptidase n=1 Tax=Siculibacillus lacustris TaxID=1549641 RepID=A0A4Q9VXY4_9HYPH|nr:M3 family oligoendopeptidase [Siculibacillus lacustris]TBW40804.1 M3 family oligoendopeptidase [Siculibacillus lacustris]
MTVSPARLSVVSDQARSGGSSSPFGALPEWDLGDLYPSIDGPEVAADLARGLATSRDFELRAKGRLGAIAATGDATALLGLVRAYEAIQDLLGKIGSFAGLVYAGDTTDAGRAKFYGDVQDKLTQAGTHLLFFELELNRIDDAAIDALIGADAGLAHYRPWFEDIRKEKPHQLSDEIEKLFHEKYLTGAAAWNRLFDETVSSLRFRLGEEELTLEPTLARLQDADEGRRREAAEALAATFRANLRTFTLITNVLAKDKEISDTWRHFEDPADARHLSNRVERAVVDALVAAARAAFPRLSHRYYALKAKWMGKTRLEHWDRNAPLASAPSRVIAWDEARDTVLSAYGRFSPRLAELGKRFFDNPWIDAPTRPGKAPGAFAHPTVPSSHPYLLVNYQGKVRDVMTLAHELGHGVHQLLAGANGPLMAPTPLTLAETASVFGEMLTFRALLADAGSKDEKRAMLASKVEDMINTVVRQIAFYTFERKVHEARRAGELTSEDICRFWMEVQGESLGPSIRLADGYESFWVYISHFVHSPFYVYAYAFGDCLVNSLYGAYQRAPEGFPEKYFALLEAGGTKHHTELLAPFGLDATDPAFWSVGLSVIEGLIDELEAMEG